MGNTDFTKKIYLVGGAVRDQLLGLPIKDKDYVAVGYSPKDFLHLPKVGKNFPVYWVDKHTQIALARRESKVARGYNGFCYEIEHITLYEDLKRRDLTINAMALDESSGEIIDPFKGREDLENKVLRHTSLAFCEDPLRVIRIARFRAKLGELWQIHPHTKTLIATMKESLAELEPNRVYQEIALLLNYEKSYLFFQTLLELCVLDRVFPLISSLKALKLRFYVTEISAFDYTMKVLEALKAEESLLKLSALYYCLFANTFLTTPSLTLRQREQSFEKCLDMQIPKMLKKSMFLLMSNHQRIKKIQHSQDLEILSFLESFKRNKGLLKSQIRFFYAQESVACLYSKETLWLPIKKIWKIFYAICNYSPKDWIDNAIPKPSGKEIQEHILQEKLKIIAAFKAKKFFFIRKGYNGKNKRR
ncbi:polynucleotide adenylyltransferase [Helicobacter mesocricetorum]|uniref:polynucleotide adenylyltransferase n=1 Tax=Helicobacter mesocricetorum TaxID=87012 RepID=UPI000CF03B84|nr:polynucleotide adenylyltransferase [Helicobacter mesocricetorum]